MKKIYLGIAASLALAGTAYADSKQSYETNTKGQVDADGSYKTENSSESTDAAGTTRKTQSDEKSTVNSDGTRKFTKDSKATTDPKGLMNKSSSEVKVYGKSDTKGNSSREVTTDSIDKSGREFSKDTDTKRKVKSDGTVESTSTENISDNPRGMMNKTTGQVVKKTTENPNGTVSSKTTKKIDGTVVDETNN